MDTICIGEWFGEGEMRVLVAMTDRETARGGAEGALSRRLTGPSILFDVAPLDDAPEFLRTYDYDVLLLLAQDPAAVTRLRRGGAALPILVRGPADSAARIALLEAGADDVVSEHCEPAELRARLIAIARRFHGHDVTILTAGAAELHLGRMEVSIHGCPVPLTPKEYAILELLFLRRGLVHAKSSIVNHVYGAEDGPAVRTLDVIVCKLRKKLAAAGAPDLVATVWGSGLTLRDVLPQGRGADAPQLAAA